MFWNQKEVFVGNSMQKFSEIRYALSSNKIDYKYNIVNHESSMITGSIRSKAGSFGENIDYSNLYYVYVHKKDYEKACAILHLG